MARPRCGRNWPSWCSRPACRRGRSARCDRAAAPGPRGRTAPGAWAGALVLLLQQRIAADEGRLLVEGDGEAEPGLERRVLLADVMAPMAVGLLDAQASPWHACRRASGRRAPPFPSNTVEHADGVLRRHIELPAELAHIADAGGARRRVADCRSRGRCRRERRRWRDRPSSAARQQRAAVRPHDAEHGVGGW